MEKHDVRLAQEILAKAVGYPGKLDGIPGPLTDRFAMRVPGPRPAGWGAFSSARRAIAAAQMALTRLRHDPGPIDGYMGQRTEAAAAAYLGTAWDRPAAAAAAARRGTPWGTEATMREIFGPPGGRDCTAGRVRVPWPMVLAWDTGQAVSTVSCHALIAPALGRVFEAVADTHKPEEIEAIGAHLYGGCYNLRAKRGGDDLSTHAWAVALDFDPLRNRLRWKADKARLAQPDAARFLDCFEAEGFTSLGRAANFDWMHIQAPAP